MKIVGFGDSFITPTDPDKYVYTNIVAKHFDTTFESYGLEGTGAWDAYFQFKKYMENNEDPDVVIFVWSTASRLYHSIHRQICYGSTVANKESTDPVWVAARHYYDILFDFNKAEIEHVCFYYWFDNYLKTTYPDLKVIHMWGFCKNSCDFGNIDEMEYLHTFTNGMEVRPALIHLSYLDGWIKDLQYETRPHHMTPKMHLVLSKNLIKAIENYASGTRVNIEL